MNALLRGVVRSARAELLRLGRWPAAWILAGTWFALNLTFVYVFPYLAYTTGDASRVAEEPADQLIAAMLPTAVPASVLQGTPLFGGAILLILGALAAGSGYAWGTWKTVLTQGPSRAAALGGTLAALATIVLGVVLTTLVLDLGVASLVAAVESQPATLPGVADVVQGVGAAALVLGMWTALGVLIGLLTRSPALAVGLGLVWALVVENLLRGVSGLLDGLSVVTDHLPGTAAGSLVGALTASVPGSAGTPGVLSTLDGGTALVVLGSYLAVWLAAALTVMARRDVT